MTATKHPEWAAFVAAIVANPDDDTVRLVAADFLEEHGDPDRAAFIRIQVQLAKLETDGEGKSLEADQLRAKERAFLNPLSMHPKLWGADECPELVKMNFRRSGRDSLEGVMVEGAERLSWRRGFLFAVWCPAREWQQHGLAIRKRQPIRMLNLLQCEDFTVADWLGMLPLLRGLVSLQVDIAVDGSAVDFAVNLARLEWLRSLLLGVRVSLLQS